jgi:hypothetical protein
VTQPAGPVTRHVHPGVETRGDEFRRRLPLLVPDFASEHDCTSDGARVRLSSPFDGDGLALSFTVDGMRAKHAPSLMMDRVQRESEGFIDLVWQSAWDRASCGDFLKG